MRKRPSGKVVLAVCSSAVVHFKQIFTDCELKGYSFIVNFWITDRMEWLVTRRKGLLFHRGIG